MNKNSNIYTIIYAALLVVAVAAILAFVSTSLKDKQQSNVDQETKLSILKSVGRATKTDNVKDVSKYIETEYDRFITDSYIVNIKGEKVPGDAFRVNLKEQFDIMRGANADPSKIKLPVFVCTLADGRQLQIFSVYGAGLWGPIWGYISLEDDFDTIYGALFGHKGETPGLGAEIATDHFRRQFAGKKIFNDNAFCSISIVKGGAPKGDVHGVDAISGGSITSRSLQKTIQQWFEYYLPYIEKEKNDEKGDL